VPHVPRGDSVNKKAREQTPGLFVKPQQRHLARPVKTEKVKRYGWVPKKILWKGQNKTLLQPLVNFKTEKWLVKDWIVLNVVFTQGAVPPG
jgi:hypothetical protein